MMEKMPANKESFVNVTCKLGAKGCFQNGRCHMRGSCENKVITKADRIRVMNDEELARKMVDTASYYDWGKDEVFYYFPNGTTKTNHKPTAIAAWLEWLQQPEEG